jgi:hypothetical protein
MDIKTIPLSQLEADPRATLNECLDSGQAIVVELPDARLVAIQPLDASEEDGLINDLLTSSPRFQAILARSKSSPRKPFPSSSASP